MNFVQPIRDPEIIADIKKNLRKQKDIRNYILFVVGINTGLRISDILQLRVKDLRKNKFHITEKKTGKQKSFEMNPTVRYELLELLKDREDDDVLIKSREGVNKPINRSMAYKILNKIAEEYKLVSIGTHTLRKTYGYHFFQRTKDLVMLQKIFNHPDPAFTLRYIGITKDSAEDTTEDSVNAATRKFKL